MPDSIQKFLDEHGHASDVVIPEDLFEAQKADELHRTDRALPKDGPTYRDGRKRHSAHVTVSHGTDDRGRVAVGHLEFFNPEHHPILHALIDCPLWYAVFYWNAAHARIASRIEARKDRIRENLL